MWSPTSAHLDLDVDGWSDRAIGRIWRESLGYWRGGVGGKNLFPAK